MIHKSKLDGWIVAAILLSIAVLLVVGDYWIVGPILMILLLCAWPQTYETKPEGLLIRGGLMRRFIPYSLISSVGPAFDGAWFDRVLIQYGPSGELLITPADPARFLSDIARRAPHLARRGQGLVASFV